MQVPSLEIVRAIEDSLNEKAKKLTREGYKPKLTTILVGKSSEQESFVKIKEKAAKRIGVDFNFIHLKRTPMFQKFAQLLKTESEDPKTSGIIIQQPLPAQLDTNSIYRYIPRIKEIEGHRGKSQFYPPLGMAILTILKFIYSGGVITPKLLIEPEQDKKFFRSVFKQKRIVLIGRGITGGRPIGKTLTDFKINYINVNSHTHEPEQYYKEADIIISAVGKKVITPDVIKPGVVLLTAGLRKEGSKLRGDYNVEEIENIASYYTKTPGGVGPLDVTYLFKNLIDAAQQLAKE